MLTAAIVEFICSTVANGVAVLMTVLYSILSFYSCHLFDTEGYLQRDRLFVNVNEVIHSTHLSFHQRLH
jgi:hypothetical protein